jgi:hypothetical protein
LDVAVADASEVTNEGGFTTVTNALPTALAETVYIGGQSHDSVSGDTIYIDIYIYIIV